MKISKHLCCLSNLLFATNDFRNNWPTYVIFLLDRENAAHVLLLTSNAKYFLPVLLSSFILPLEADPLVNKRPLSSLKIKASDHVELEGGDSMFFKKLEEKNPEEVELPHTKRYISAINLKASLIHCAIVCNYI